MSIWVLLLLFLGGCVSGLLAGLLGFGGGMLFMLLFGHYLASLKVPDEILPQLILANSMFAMCIGGLSGSLKHYLNANFYGKPVLIIGCMASICAILVTHFFIHSPWYNKQVFTFIFILIVLYLGCKVFFIEEIEKQDGLENPTAVNILFLIGSVGGSLSALAGIGGGIAMIPMLTRFFQMGIKKATAISLGVITITSFAVSIYSVSVAPRVMLPYSYGLLVLPMVLPVSLGCLLFSPVGVALSRKMTPGRIKLLYFVFMVIAISNMLHSLWYS